MFILTIHYKYQKAQNSDSKLLKLLLLDNAVLKAEGKLGAEITPEKASFYLLIFEHVKSKNVRFFIHFCKEFLPISLEPENQTVDGL